MIDEMNDMIAGDYAIDLIDSRSYFIACWIIRFCRLIC